MTGDFTLHLPKLDADGSNWITYRDRIKWTITMRGLGDHLTNDTITDTYKNAGDIGTLKPEQRWTADKIVVNQILSATIPDLVFNQIKTAYEPKDVWAKLKVLYEGKSRSMMVDLGKKFQNMRCGESDDVRVHLEKLADLRERLSSFGRTINDAEYTSVIIGSLPPSYDAAVDSLANSYEASDKDLTSTAITRMAINEQEKRQLRKGKSQDADEAFTAEERKNKRKNIECYNCHKKGHYKSQCWAKGGGDEGNWPKNPKQDGDEKDKSKRDSANAADESWAAIMDADDARDEGKSCNTLSALTDSAPLTSRPEVELYDSGASRHMSPFSHRFTNLHSIPPRPITAANSRVFYAIGAGDLKIDVPNGASSTTITLKDTLYAPDMGLTVVSVSRIAAAGYSVNFEGTSCKIKSKTGKIVGDIPASPNGLYKVEHALAAAAAAEQVDIPTPHHSQISADPICSHTNAVTELHPIDSVFPSPLSSYDYAKTTCKPIHKELTTPFAVSFGDEVHSAEWGQRIWAHQDAGSKLDARTAEVRFPPPLTTQQAAATPHTPPTSVVLPTHALPPINPIITPTTTPNARASLLNTLLQIPATATDTGKEELPDEEPIIPKKTTPAPAPLSACTPTHLATESSQQANPQQSWSARPSGGARSGPGQYYHPDWTENEAFHLIDVDGDDNDDHNFVFLAEHDTLTIAAAQDASDDPKTRLHAWAASRLRGSAGFGARGIGDASHWPRARLTHPCTLAHPFD